MTKLDDVHTVVTKSLGLPASPTDLSGLPGGIGDISNFLGIGGGGGGIDIVGAVKKALGEFISGEAGRDAFEKLTNELAKVLKKADGICRELGELLAAILKQIVEFILENIEKLRDFFNDLFDKLVDHITDHLPTAFLKGPLDTLKSLPQLKKILLALNPGDTLQDRLKVSFNSFAALITVATGKQTSDFLFGAFVDSIQGDLEKILNGNDPEKIIKDRVKELLLPSGILTDIFKSVKDGNILFWADLPAGLGPGNYNTWLNDFVGGKYLGGSTNQLERQFRIRLSSNLDAYFRHRFAGAESQRSLLRFDERTSTELLCDLITVVCDTVINFVLEPECYPVHDLDWGHFEDVGRHFGTLASRQIKAAVRAIVGTVFRGVWIWSVQNVNLIEGIGTLASSILTSLCEGVIRNLSFTFQIMTCYENTLVPAGAATGAYVKVHEWKSGETYDKALGPGVSNSPLWYAAFIRSDPRVVTPAVQAAVKNSPIIRGIIEDLGAYIDMSYRQFRIDSRFPTTLASSDTVTVDAPHFSSTLGKLVVRATTTNFHPSDGPRPVLRVYCCCQVVVMTPGVNAGDKYEAFLDVGHLPAHFEVTVLSNHGGKDSKAVALP